MGRTDRILEPVERLSEILFGLIMALTVTGAVSVATADRLQVRAMVVAALGCNIAWGIIASMYMGNVALVIMNIAAIPFFVWIVKKATPLIVPLVISLTVAGGYSVTACVPCATLPGKSEGSDLHLLLWRSQPCGYF